MTIRRLLLLAGLVVAVMPGALLLTADRTEGREAPVRVAAYFSPDGGAAKAIQKEIRGARQSVDVAVYVLSAPALATDLIAAHKRGVKVRVLLDGRMSRRWSQADELEEHEVPLWRVVLEKRRDDHSAPAFHHKYAVIDGKTVITGSYNWTVMAEERNHENLLVVRDPTLAKTFTETFEKALALARDDDTR